MKLIVDIKSVKNLERYQVHGLVFNHEFLSDTHEGYLSLEEIKTLVDFKNKNDVLLLANVNRLFTEDELDQLYLILDELVKVDIDYFIFSDLAILAYFKSRNMHHKLIYNARTMVTNREDALFWQNQGLYGAFIANELPLEDILEISDIGHGILEVYGYHQIFYSKRNLVSLYFENKRIDTDYRFQHLDLIEEIRDERYPITETKYATYVYSPYKYGIFKELSKLSKLQMIKISQEFIKEEDLIQVLEIYYKAINEGFTDELYNSLKNLDEDIKTGFLYQKTVLLKGEE